MKGRVSVLFVLVFVAACTKSAPPTRTPRPTRSPTATESPGPGSFLGGVSFADADHGIALWSICHAKPHTTPGATVQPVDCDTKVARSDDGGSSWRWIGNVTPDVKGPVRLATPSDGYIGSFATHDGGRTWRKSTLSNVQDLLVGPDEDYAITGPACPETKLCAYTFRVTTDRGRTWSRNSVMPPTYTDFTTARHGRSVWIYSSSLDQVKAALLRSIDGGAHWMTTKAPCVGWQSVGVSATSAQDVWLACGQGPSAGSEGKLVYRSGDGGAHWRLAAASEIQPGATKPVGTITSSGYVSNLAAVSETTALIANSRGPALLRSTDGGDAWDAPADGIPGESFPSGLQFVDADHGWYSGHTSAQDPRGSPLEYEYQIFRTTDGGATWTLCPVPTG